MALVAIAGRGDGVRWSADGKSLHTAASLEALFNHFNEPSGFLCEPEFYDGLRDVRRELERWSATFGHRVLGIPDRVRRVLEAASSTSIEGVGPARLFDTAVRGSVQLDKKTFAGTDFWDRRGALEVAHMVDLFQRKAEALAKALTMVPRYGALDDAERNALGDGDDYCDDVLLAAVCAGSAATSRDEFEAYLGLNASGYGALTRSVRVWYRERNNADDFAEAPGLKWSDYRRALRALYHAIKA